jgi:copper chaperone CopZ
VADQLNLKIQGMSCDHCVNRVKAALNTVAGVQVEDVKVGSARVSYNPATTSPAEIAAAVTNAGYEAAPATH